MEVTGIDTGDYRKTLSQFCTGVVLVTGCVDGQPAGFAAQSFTSVSLEPPLVAVCPARTSVSWPRVRAGGGFCINILGVDQQPLCEAFARSGGDKFRDVSWRRGVTGAPIIDGVLAYIDCELQMEHDGGDHVIAVGRVRQLHTLDPTGSPLLFFRGAYGRFAV